MPLKIIQLSDTHISEKKDALAFGKNTYTSFQHVLCHLQEKEKNIDLLVLSGDISEDGSLASYQLINELMDDIGIPFLTLPGNHDEIPAMKEGFHSSWHIQDKLFCAEAYTPITLNTKKDGVHSGFLEASELDFLKTQLNTHQKPLIFLHHPPISVYSPFMDKYMLKNDQDFLACLEQHPHVTSVFFGHIHQEITVQRKNISFFGCPSTCIQFTPGADSLIPDSLLPGYRIIECFDDHISTHVRRVNTKLSFK